MAIGEPSPKRTPSDPPPSYAQSTEQPPAGASKAPNVDLEGGPQHTIASSSIPAGPTPITAQGLDYIPFDDLRSPYARAQAISRARWRFFGALFWAWVVFMVLGGFGGWSAAEGW